MNEEILIKVKNLKKSFGDNPILKGINFELKKGERVVILGPSGSGKSTFLRCINRLEEPTAGEIYYKDTLMTDHNIRKIREDVGMVFQHFNLINNLTVMENLTLAPFKLHIGKRKAVRKRAMELLKEIGLEDKADVYPASLSGGQKQRVAIIRAMMLEPEVLLFDEPTSALDPEAIEDVLALIRELAGRGMTIIVVSHEMGFAKEVASRIVFLDGGKIIEEDAPEEFFNNPKTERVKEFLEKIL
ncbi:MAG: amino acid ABC transporter ATP-binding protein [Candidatus Saccharibacteria bacterium]|nr:amino acid ABC transporter ATP-binding protein [Candidatus Saccharibacteria bacterium]